ncbi:MAG: pyridoxine 5'-phosphate synthase [Nitrococcus sp.]|nr:pyridoxine 5'-phosphate synthase [Nitrococcus sp.]
METTRQPDEVLLGVNIDHVATLRQARGTRYPDPVQAAMVAEQAGADGITLHLREDRRHIQERDVKLLRDIVQTRLNLEMAMTAEMLTIAERYRPHDSCIVPERREELTTEGGLDVRAQLTRSREACARLGAAGVQVALFIDPEIEQVDAAVAAGAPCIELHTGHYAEAVEPENRSRELERIRAALRHGLRRGLQVNAGHGLNYHNVKPVAAMTGLSTLNIGHAIVARAVFVGFAGAVHDMRRLILEARAWPSSE